MTGPNAAREGWAVAVVSIALALGAAGCSRASEDAAVPTASASAPPAPPTTEAVPSTTPATTTTSSTSTTTPQPVFELVLEHVADLPGRAVTSPFTDGTSIIGLSLMDAGQRYPAIGLVRLDTAGVVTQEAPIDGSDYVSAIAEASGRRLVMGSFTEPSDSYICGLRELDPATLDLSATIALPTENGCGGPMVADDANPSVLLAADVREPIVFSVDTATGAVTSIGLDPVIPSGYVIAELISLGGNTYARCVAFFDSLTGEEATAPDGTPLQPMIARIDAATGTVTAAPVSGPFLPVGERLVVRLDDARAQIIDPATLASTDVAAGEIPLSDLQLYVSGDTAWTLRVDNGGLFTVARRDRATQQVLHDATADSGFGGDQFVSYGGVSIGDEFYVVAAQQVLDEGPSMSLTKLFRAALRPVS